MDPELTTSLQDLNRSLYLEPMEEKKDRTDLVHLVSSEQTETVSSSQFSIIDEQIHEAAQNCFGTHSVRSHSLVPLQEYYQFLDWTHVISSSLTGIYAKFVRDEAKALERELEIERQRKKLIQYLEHLEENFREFLLKLKLSH